MLQSMYKIPGQPEKNLEANFKSASFCVSASDFLILIENIEDIEFVFAPPPNLQYHKSTF